MKIKLYSSTSDPYVQDSTAENELRVFSNDEWAYLWSTGDCTEEYKEIFKDKEKFLSLIEDRTRKEAERLGEYLLEIGARDILCLSSGPTHHEYLIKQKIPETRITVSDFNPFLVDVVRRLFPEYEDHLLIDIKKQDFTIYKGKFDTVMLMLACYVLNDDEFVSFLRNVRKIESLHLILVEDGFVNNKRYLQYLLNSTLRNLVNIKKQLQGTPPVSWGRFHGWGRTRGHVSKLVKRSGVFSLESFHYLKEIRPFMAFYHLTPR